VVVWTKKASSLAHRKQPDWFSDWRNSFSNLSLFREPPPTKGGIGFLVPIEDMQKIIDYLWHDEQLKYRRNKSDNHIYCSFKIVKR
jgi:hypothetical protein